MSLDNKLIELENIKSNWDQISHSTNSQTHAVKGKHYYYHYTCDGINDIGWGCGYRTLQTMCSWIRFQLLEKYQSNQIDKVVRNVPRISEIQNILVECGDKPSSFSGSKEWIGCFEASLVIDYLYDLPCKILHCEAGTLLNNIDSLREHFRTIKSPIMMGGDMDNASKGILGVCDNYNTLSMISSTYLLVANPHYSDKTIANGDSLVNEGWIKWTDSQAFEENISFYNFCMPQKI